MNTESQTSTAWETALTYIKTPYFAVLCIVLLIFLVWWYKDSFTPKKSDKVSDLDSLIASIHKKQKKIKGDD